MLTASELQFERDGAEIISGAVSLSEMEVVADAFLLNQQDRPGRRVMNLAGLAPLLKPTGSLGRLASGFSPTNGATMRPVRVVLFDKTAATNWAVPWHQDRTIAVAARHDVAGFANWNRKDGIDHVEPPMDLLARMVTLRLHLDDTGADNGALDILPGSHRLGRITAGEVVRRARMSVPVTCCVQVGDVLAMRLTTIHKSEKALQPASRRVLHVDYSPDMLPLPLRWSVD